MLAVDNSVYNSDKEYWHHYIDFYERELASFDCRNVLEFGVWKGASIRWLMDKYPSADIYGVDILSPDLSWPQGKRVHYFQVDQGDVDQIKTLFGTIEVKFDLVIEDGSHIPEHQRNCLVESISHIQSGGVYIVEDIHTSHPRHPYFKKSKSFFKPLSGPLHLLLGIEHIKSLDSKVVLERFEELARHSLFTLEEIEFLFEKIESIKIYKRTTLPRYCYACGNDEFNYLDLRCKCGTHLYAETDSMSALIRIK
ncbi:MAG: hypothetical protein DSY50_01520 [Desulfobulbus sp.]|nr:MAG: hypothetical protein DSY50_01520 [Desulfobulbus sp.]